LINRHFLNRNKIEVQKIQALAYVNISYK